MPNGDDFRLIVSDPIDQLVLEPAKTIATETWLFFWPSEWMFGDFVYACLDFPRKIIAESTSL